MALSLRSIRPALAHQKSAPLPKRAIKPITSLSPTKRIHPQFLSFQVPNPHFSLRQYCTFKDIDHTPSATIAEEIEELEDEVLEDEIPLVESHWDAFENELRKRLEDRIQATMVEIWDKTRPNCGVVLEIHVTSSKFASLSKVEATRLVTSSLQGLVDDVHAMTIKTRVPS